MVVQDDITGNLVYGIKVDTDTLVIKDQALLERHQLLTHSNVLRFEGFKKLTNNEYIALYESYECTFEEEIQKRRVKNARFTEQEILGILQNVTAALTYFQNKDIYHGQVTSENILKKGDEYKLLDLVLFEKHSSTYQIALGNPDESKVRLLSPELKEALANHESNPIFKKYKQDIYSLGIIILDAMILEVNDTYSISDKFKQATRFYSEFLIEVVTKMVQESELLRIEAATCNKIVENMYYGFTVTENSEQGAVVNTQGNQNAESIFQTYHDLELSGRQSISPKKGFNSSVGESEDYSSHLMFKTDLTMMKNSYTKSDFSPKAFKDSITPRSMLANSVEVRGGLSFQEKLLLQTLPNNASQDLQIVHEEIPSSTDRNKRHEEILPDALYTESCYVNHGTANSVTENQFFKLKQFSHTKEDNHFIPSILPKTSYFDSKVTSAGPVPDERVHTFGSTHIATEFDENNYYERLKKAGVSGILSGGNLTTSSLTAPSTKPPYISSEPFAPITNQSAHQNRDFINIEGESNRVHSHGMKRGAASLNIDNVSTKDTHGYDPLEGGSLNFKDIRNMAKRRNQAVLVSDSYQDTDFRNMLMSGEGGISDRDRNQYNPEIASSQSHWNKSSYPIRNLSQPTAAAGVGASGNVINIEDYGTNNEEYISYLKEKYAPSSIQGKVGNFHSRGVTGTTGTNGSSTFADFNLKYNSEAPESQRYKKHYRTKTMMTCDYGHSSGKDTGIFFTGTHDFGSGTLHHTLKTSASESMYKNTLNLHTSPMGRTRRRDHFGGKSMSYALEQLQNEVKHSFLAEADHFLQRRQGPHKRRTNSTIDALHSSIEKIRGASSIERLKFSTLANEITEKGLISQVMNDTKKSLAITLPNHGRMMHSRHTSEIYEDNSRYLGEMQGDLRHGQGKLTFQDGRYYEGTWKLGRMEGYGVLYSRAGTIIYEGEWRNNRYEGDGIIHNQNSVDLLDNYLMREFNKDEGTWLRYEGEFNNDKWNGFGKLVLSNGDIIQGIFKLDKLHGKASYNTHDGQVLAGEWLNNALVRVF